MILLVFKTSARQLRAAEGRFDSDTLPPFVSNREMNSRDLEQVDICRRYLMERADRSRSRLVRDQIRRWIEWIDAIRRRDERRDMSESIVERARTDETPLYIESEFRLHSCELALVERQERRDAARNARVTADIWEIFDHRGGER